MLDALSRDRNVKVRLKFVSVIFRPCIAKIFAFPSLEITTLSLALEGRSIMDILSGRGMRGGKDRLCWVAKRFI